VAAFVAWHKRTGGISRFEKFANFFKNYLEAEDWQYLTDVACLDFGRIIFEGLCHCPFIPGFEDYLAWSKTENIPVAVNTGGAQDEIREVFKIRGLLDKFKVVLGSPTTKYNNMVNLREMGLLEPGTLYFGDSKLDFDLAQDFVLNFVYVEHESEWQEGKAIALQANSQVILDFRNLL
jgi:phosphoglycolate phosphatase-like HAD superfamily hydrolase